MTSLTRLAFAACLLPCTALGANTLEGVDAYRELLRFRFANVGVAAALEHDTAGLVAPMLVSPSSPYTRLVEEPALTNEVWWLEFVDQVRSPVSQPDEALRSASVLAALHWDMGLTKARPGVELGDRVDLPAVWRAYGGKEAAASAVKAAVDADIFWQARDMAGNRYSALAAGYAVALQILRDRIASMPAADLARNAIKADVLDRFMRARSPDELDEADRQYLSLLLNDALTRWAPGGTARTGLRELPTMYRVARVAAAYRDTQGYLNGGTCQRDGTENRRTAGTLGDADDRPLCFIAATDRSVLTWYRRELRLQISGFLPNQHTHDGVARLLHWMGGVLALLDIVAFAEFTEALISDSLEEEGAIEEEDADIASQRSQRLTCRIRP